MTDNATIVKILNQAVGIAETGGDLFTAIWNSHLDVLPQSYGRDYEHVVFAVAKYLGVPSINDWVDDPGRTQQEVVDALRAVARNLEEEG